MKPELTDREKFDLATFQRIDPKPDIERQEEHEFRVFWFLGIPLGLIAAFAVTVATDMGTAGFFFAWLAFSAIISGAIGSIPRKKR
jgi:hypothetical protein